MEAQRFPDDFDGILGGAAAGNLIPIFSAMIWNAQQVADPSNNGFLPSANLPAMGTAAAAQCASAKLVPTDNFFNDPRQCHFNPQVLLCTGAPDSSCLTQSQIDAVEAVLAGPTTASGRVAPGFEPEFASSGEWASWMTQAGPTPVGGTLGAFFGIGLFTNFLSSPEGLDGLGSFDINSSPFEAVAQLGSILNAYNPDLRSFWQRGGKLIQYHGWADPLISPLNSVNYFQSVVEFNNKYLQPGDALLDTQGFFRLFMAPGMGHCGGGPGLISFGQNGGSGPAESDMFSALERWVETGVAPDKIIATGGTAANTFARPLCPYPQKAEYVSGDPTKADSFACGGDRQR
jgi:feruloyl esterase